MPPRKTIITLIAPPGTDFSPVLPYLQRSGVVEIQNSSLHIDAGLDESAKRLRKKLLLIRATVQAILEIHVRVGAASSKSVSLIAARQAAPGGMVIVEYGQESTFLERVVIDLLPGIGRRTATYLRNRGVTTIGKFSRLPQVAAVQLFGVSGIILREFSKGLDPRDVLPSQPKLPVLTGRRSLFSLFGTAPGYSAVGTGANAR